MVINPTKDFYCWQKFDSFNIVQCNAISRPVIFHRPNLYGPTGKFKQPGRAEVRLRPYFYFANLISTKTNLLIELQALPGTRVLLNFKDHQLVWFKMKYSEFVKYVLTNYRLMGRNKILYHR